MTIPKCLEKFLRAASCSSTEAAALQSERKITLKSRMPPSRAVLSQHTLVATPMIATVSRPSRRRMFSSCVL